MKRLTIILALLFLQLIYNSCAIAQTTHSNQNNNKTGWISGNPFHTDVFVENHGQFDKWVKPDLPILYVLNNADKIFFTKQGLIFKIQKLDSLSEEEREHSKNNKKDEKDEEQNIFYVTMNWEGCNENAELIASELSEGYYTFGEKGYENVQAKGYKKLLYKELYPNIDVEYTIPVKGGIKYKLILHPGANPELIKMRYSGDIELIKSDSGDNICIEALAGTIIDHAPESYYETNHYKIASSFHLHDKCVSINMTASNSETIIIDPWTTTPTSLYENNNAVDIDYDYIGNVYISGGDTPYKLSKYSNTGVFQWSFTNPADWAYTGYEYFYSKFCVLSGSGTTYMGEGFSYNDGSRVMKISNSGNILFTSPYFGYNNELWSLLYNKCIGKLMAFGGGTNYNDNIKIIADTNLSACIPSNFDGLTTSFNDVASAIIDKNGDFYAITTSSSYYPTEGHLKKSNFSTNYNPPCAFNVNAYYYFDEGFYYQSVHVNALAINSDYVFSYDGKTLKAWNKTNGSLLNALIVDSNYYEGMWRQHEGIDADECNNVYVGGKNKVHVFSFNGNSFNPLSPITTDIIGEVHDIKLNRVSGQLYVCGNGFVTETIAPITCSVSPYLTITITKDSCLGNVCVTASGGMPPYRYLWNNGSADSCVKDLKPGVYKVTVTDNSCVFNSQTATVNILCNVDIIIPNIITPNSDGFNDYFEIKNIEFWNLVVSIYNRWGVKVYEDNNYKNNWDAKYKGKELPDGVYYYLIKAKNLYTEIEKQYHGSLTIMK